MVTQQRYAVFNLTVAIGALVLFAALIPLIGVFRAQAGFAMLSLTALGPLYWFRRKRQTFDERDRFIFLRAIQITFGAFWLLLFAGLTAVYYAFETHNSIPVESIPFAMFMSWAILQLLHSAILLFLYRRS